MGHLLFCLGLSFWVPFNASQHETTTFLVWDPRKKCAAPFCVTIPYISGRS